MRSNISVRDIREKNKNDILTAIINNNGITRNQLAKISNVSLMTISNVVEDLLESNCIFEVKCKASIGRTPTMLHFNEKLGKFLCIDLTSNKGIKYLITNAKKEVISSGDYSLDKNIDYMSNLIRIAEDVSNKIRQDKIKILGVGIITPGPHITNTDTIATNLIKEQQDIELLNFIQSYFGTDIINVNHDVNLAAIAEAKALSLKSSLFYIHLSEGVGGSYIINGNVIQGKDLQAGDIGQLLISLDDGSVECVENIISLSAIENNSPIKLSIDEILNEYKNNNQEIVCYLDKLFSFVTRQIHNISWLLNPEYIIIYSSNKTLGKTILRYYEGKTNFKNLSSSALISTQVKLSDYEDNPAIFGTLDQVISEYVNIICKH